MPPVASLKPDPDLAEAFAADLAETPPEAPEGDAQRISKRLTLVFPPDPAAFPEREEFEERFKQLSAIENLRGEGDDSFAQLAVRARSDRELLDRLLRIYGYYDGRRHPIGQRDRAGQRRSGKCSAQRKGALRYYAGHAVQLSAPLTWAS